MIGTTHWYTDEKNAQIVIALLKAHGIKRVIANPGTTNIAIVGSVQNDPWFEVYSGIDERHSAYMAVGLAAETGEPVVLSCTGATASRNYLPALTEAYYRKLPVLAITSMQNFDNAGQLAPQAIDRSRVPADAVVKSIELRTVRDASEEQVAVRKVNDALLALKRNGGGPVHINLEMGGCMTFHTKSLPPFAKIERYDCGTLSSAPKPGRNARIALFLGSGRCPDAWAGFAESRNVAVIADESVDYTGGNRVHASLLCSQFGFAQSPELPALKPDLIIDAGEVSGDYPVLSCFRGVAPVWRVSPDGEIRSRFGNPEIVFEMPAECFVRHCLEDGGQAETPSAYCTAWTQADSALRGKIPELPFSNPWIAKTMAPLLPDGCVLHVGILNSLRSWNLFPAPERVRCHSNVGGFGIDGGLSTLIGASLADGKKLYFGVLGDLSFFYDLNSLGNRSVGKNLRILLVNNGCGTEFNMFFHPGHQFGPQTNEYIAAGRHFANMSRDLVRNYSRDLGFRYLSASGKEEFLANVDEFVSPEAGQSMVFECFTTPQDESEVHRLLDSLMPYVPPKKGLATTLLPPRLKKAVKVALGM